MSPLLSFCLIFRTPEEWTQGIGHVSEKMIKEHMPKPGKGLIYVCGPNGMLDFGKLLDFLLPFFFFFFFKKKNFFFFFFFFFLKFFFFFF